VEKQKAFLPDKTNESVDNHFFKYYHYFFHSSKTPLMVVNNQLDIVQINKQACEMFEEIGTELPVQSLSSLLEQVPREILYPQLELVRERGNYKDEWILLNNSNTYNHIEFEAEYDGDNYYFTLRDVTTFKKREKDYTISTRIFKDLFTIVTEGIIVFDQSGLILEVNGAFLSFVKSDKSELIGREFHEFLQENSKLKWQNEWEVLNKVGKISSTVEWNYQGKQYFFKYTTYRNVYKNQFISVLKDVTEKKMIELRLKTSQEILTYVFDHANDAIILTDDMGIIREVNNVACRLFEGERLQLVGKKTDEFIVRKEKKFNQMVELYKKYGSVREELFFTTLTGKELLLELSSKRVEGSNSGVTIFRNVSERYEMEMKLKSSERQFRYIFEGMLDGLILWNDERVVDINEASTIVLNMTKEMITSKTFPEIVEQYPEQRDWIERVIKRANENNQAKMFEETITICYKDGSVRHVEMVTKKNFFSGMHLTVVKDVTEKLIMQERIRKSDTLNVVGELAAGIAHEIRNPMTALKGFIQLLQASVKEDYSSYFSIITSELGRIDSIITEFLILAKPQAIHYVEKDLNIIVKETIDLLNGEAILRDVELVPILAKGAINLHCEPNQLKQVLINLIKNAIESMREGGQIKIKTEACKDDFVKVMVVDEGCGISEEKLKKLGEPFYTTKERGTGLGLMVSYKIIKEHGGKVDVKSKEGIGTSFSILLPCTSDMCCKVF